MFLQSIILHAIIPAPLNISCLPLHVFDHVCHLFLVCHSSDSGQLEQKLEQASATRKDVEESTKHICSLEKQIKSMKQEREAMQKVQAHEQLGNLCPLFLPSH